MDPEDWARAQGNNLIVVQVSVCYILKHLEDRKAWSVHIYCTWCDIILIFKLQRRTRLTDRSSIQFENSNDVTSVQ